MAQFPESKQKWRRRQEVGVSHEKQTENVRQVAFFASVRRISKILQLSFFFEQVNKIHLFPLQETLKREEFYFESFHVQKVK